MTRRQSERTEVGSPDFRVVLGERISSLLEAFPTKKEASEVAGVTVEQLGHYIAGRAKVPFEVLARLALQAGVSLDWLATGRSSTSGNFNEQLLYETIAGVAELLEEEDRTMSPDDTARVVIEIYKAELARQAQGGPRLRPAEVVRLVRRGA